ncbi:hypothetical protein [Castellaniella sp.]|uniref:hypothetical protein n=1 Tax=Castellaniella sp. TaxID=1955812 RepID=UPI0035687874
MRRVLLAAAALVAAPAAATPIFQDGFEGDAPPCCTLGGQVAGLSGSGLVLRLQTTAVDETLPIGGNGPFQFSALLTPGTAYSVSVQNQPSGQACTLDQASGTMPPAPVTDVQASCAALPSGLVWNSGTWGENWQ